MMLRNLIDGKDSSSCILIKDNVEKNGRGLLKSFICGLAKRVDTIHIVFTEIKPDRFLKGLPVEVCQKIVSHDLTNDPQGWLSQNTKTLHTDICEEVFSTSQKPSSKSAVVIDCLSTLILHRSITTTCRLLHDLRSSEEGPEIDQVIALVHRDLHDDSTLILLEHCSSSILNLTVSQKPSLSCLCDTEHKKSTGKVVKIKEQFNLEKDFSLSSVEEFHPLVSTGGRGGDGQSIDPAANLTFNLTLTDKEKEARSNVALPYVLDKQKKDSVLEKSVGAGKIFYQPDEVDDFDEEDPDEDLDI